MAVVSAFTMVRMLALAHIMLAFLFLTAPEKAADQNLVYILGSSMKLPHVTAFNKRTPVTAFVAVLLALFGLTDLTALSMSDEVASEYFAAQMPVRLVFLFALTGYTYMFKDGGLLAGARAAVGKKSAGDDLKNSFIFTFGFMEMTIWFWAYVTIRDERRQKAIKIIQKRNAEILNR